MSPMLWKGSARSMVRTCSAELVESPYVSSDSTLRHAGAQQCMQAHEYCLIESTPDSFISMTTSGRFDFRSRCWMQSRVGPVVYAHPSHKLANIDLDRTFANTECASDILVGLPALQSLQYRSLSLREPVI